MSTIHPFRSARSKEQQQTEKAMADRLAERSISDSQALQELIAILKKPFPSNCDQCDGVGIVPGKGSCARCQGTGRILMDLL